MHVTIGTLFLLYCAVRHLLTVKTGPAGAQSAFALTPGHHFGFEAAA
jgi:heme/copper-type cytochrome/quinol oxidase subunit 3